MRSLNATLSCWYWFSYSWEISIVRIGRRTIFQNIKSKQTSRWSFFLRQIYYIENDKHTNKFHCFPPNSLLQQIMFINFFHQFFALWRFFPCNVCYHHFQRQPLQHNIYYCYWVPHAVLTGNFLSAIYIFVAFKHFVLIYLVPLQCSWKV
jgi:hypothetical protein